MLRVRKPYWDKNLVPCMMERAPDWCKDVGPVQLQTVDRHGEDGKLHNCSAAPLMLPFCNMECLR